MSRTAAPAVPRLGFLGVGWIGRNRLEALARSGARVAAVADPAEKSLAAVLERHPGVVAGIAMEAVLDAEPDGIVIATPSALHAAQAMAALERGIPVFCQKPLGRTAEETRQVVNAARRADRLLAVDMSYRHTAALRALRERVTAGDLGDVYAAELVFHNAYGPDKPWFYDAFRSGGGCAMDLGIHLVDLVFWLLGGPVERVDATLFAEGRRLPNGEPLPNSRQRPGDRPPGTVETYADIRLELSGGRTARLACSWNLNAGRDAVIEVRLHGTRRGAAVVNVDGSFYDFRAELYDGTATEVLETPPDDWGGRAAVAWAERLARDPSFDPAVEELVDVADVLDRVYGR